MFDYFAIHNEIFIFLCLVIGSFYFWDLLVFSYALFLLFSLSSCKFSKESIFKADWSLGLKIHVFLVLEFICVRRIKVKLGRWLN